MYDTFERDLARYQRQVDLEAEHDAYADSHNWLEDAEGVMRDWPVFEKSEAFYDLSTEQLAAILNVLVFKLTDFFPRIDERDEQIATEAMHQIRQRVADKLHDEFLAKDPAQLAREARQMASEP